MHWKTFFRPGWKKLLVFAALVILDIFVKTPTSGCFDYCCFLRLHHERKHNDRQERNKK